MNKPQESIADFKHRIALLMRNREGGKIYSVIGAARPDPCVVRPRRKSAEDRHAESGCTDYLQHSADNCPLLLDNAKLDGILKH